MPSHFNRAKPLILLSSIIFCSASPQETFRNCRCSLPCGRALEQMILKSVIVSIKPPLQKVYNEVYNVSSLYDGERCSVPGCFQTDTLYTLRIYTNDNNPVAKILFDKADVQPECDLDGISVKNQNRADGNLSNKFLILLAFCFCFIFHL